MVGPGGSSREERLQEVGQLVSLPIGVGGDQGGGQMGGGVAGDWLAGLPSPHQARSLATVSIIVHSDQSFCSYGVPVPDFIYIY